MKKILTTLISMLFVLGSAGYSFGAIDFQLKGTVTKIDGRTITVKDVKGKEMIIEGTSSDIKVGDPVLLKGQLLKVTTLPSRALTTADKDFVMNQCQVPQVDVDVIPQLGSEAQGYILQWIDAKDCGKFAAFKNSRNYYRKLDINKPIQMTPAGFSGRWLTAQEFKNFKYIMDNAPW